MYTNIYIAYQFVGYVCTCLYLFMAKSVKMEIYNQIDVYTFNLDTPTYIVWFSPSLYLLVSSLGWEMKVKIA